MTNLKRAINRLALIQILIFPVVIYPGNIERIDFYDSPGNHLMFVTFEYEPSGVNTARSVFAPDSTFLYRTSIRRNSSGALQTEASFNFNNDTLWKSSYGSDGKSIAIQDQFGNDQIGGSVKFSGTEQMFEFFQGAGLINKMSYEKNTDGSYNKINIFDNAGTLLYYVDIRYQGTGAVVTPANRFEKLSIHFNGNKTLVVRYALVNNAFVKCDLFTLTGKHAVTLFSGNEKAGTPQRSIHLKKAIDGLAGGLYLATLSIDGKRVIRQKVLFRKTAGGF